MIDNRDLSRTNERAIQGWEEIGKMFNKTGRSMIKRKKELEQCGVIFYTYYGRPKRLTVCAFPSMLQRWSAEKTIIGEKV